MFIGRNYYTRYAEFIGVPDREFFEISLHQACEHIIPELIKADAPVVFCTQLVSQKDDETFVLRKIVHDKTRVKRRFLMIDADFEAGQENDSAQLRQNIIDLAARLNTPVMIYPTMSYPEKPRFRAVMLTHTLLNDIRYEQAMRWWFTELGTDWTDESDLRITTNRNMPMFTNEDQIAAVFSTFEDQGLAPLSSNLWKDTDLPKRTTREHTPELFLTNVEPYDHDTVMACARTLAETKPLDSYERFWYYVHSLAFDVIEHRVEEETAHEILTMWADSAAPDEHTARRWASGNLKMLHEHMDRLSDVTHRTEARPLYAYPQFRAVVDPEKLAATV